MKIVGFISWWKIVDDPVAGRSLLYLHVRDDNFIYKMRDEGELWRFSDCRKKWKVGDRIELNFNGSVIKAA